MEDAKQSAPETPNIPIEEFSEAKFKDLVCSSASKINQFIKDNPQVVYKGVPLMLAIYLLYPVFLVGWHWLPWMWSVYEFYYHMPSGTIPVATEMVRQFLSLTNPAPK